MSFRLKIVLGIALIEVILLSILVVSGLRYLQESNETQLVNRAQTTAQLFATMISDAVISMDIATIDEMIAKTLTTKEITYIRVIHAGGSIISEGGKEEHLQRPFKADLNIKSSHNDQTFDVAHNIYEGSQLFGRVELGLDIQKLEILLSAAKKNMFSVALLEIVLVGIFGLLLGGILTRQLVSLQAGAARVAGGELGHIIKVTGKDELAQTAHSFNEMSQSLATYAQKLEEARLRAEDRRARAETLLQDAMANLSQGVAISNSKEEIVLINEAYAQMHNISPQELARLRTRSDMENTHYANAFCPIDEQAPPVGVMSLSDGLHILHTQHQLSGGGIAWVDTDVTPIIEAEKKNRKLERDLLQTHKMESIGTLAGGIAHEINTPIQYIGDNLNFLQSAMGDIIQTLDTYEKVVTEIKEKKIAITTLADCEQQIAGADLEFLREEVPLAISQSSQGVNQVALIVLAMKEFSHPSAKELSLVQLNRVIERAATVCRNEWKSVAQLNMQLDENLPDVMGLENDLNQVLLNLIVNAAHAIKDAALQDGQITVRTFVKENQVVLQVQDNATGVPDELKHKIFDPFFTTKDVGKGTGQGLAICYDIVVGKHKAAFNVLDATDGGALFEIIFPAMT
ncbi:ATP-binding protein [Terasakiella pusilla]|uniref:ATP-binding protein n=1 Tax=Terasakiella pusilla TaxID=64973 RepID=UPI003AA7FB90